MAYTVWSRGRLVGETDLGFVFRYMGCRMGWFHPTELGERLMPAATGVAPALRVQCLIGPDPTAQADLRAAMDQEEALDLELRGPDGRVIATEDIGIIDTHYLQELASIAEREDEDEELSPELKAAVDHDVALILEHFGEDDEPGEWLDEATSDESNLPRYQIQVHLVDHKAVP